MPKCGLKINTPTVLAISRDTVKIDLLGRTNEAAGPGGIARPVLIHAQNTEDHPVRLR